MKVPVSLGNKLSGVKEALVDDEDYDRLSRHTWYFDQTQIYSKMTFETGRTTPKTFSLKVRMDHYVFNYTPYINARIKHINGDPYDCRRENLEVWVRDRGTPHYPKTIYLGVIETAGRLKKTNKQSFLQLEDEILRWTPNKQGTKEPNILHGGEDPLRLAQQYDLWARRPTEFSNNLPRNDARTNFLLEPLLKDLLHDGGKDENSQQ